MLIIIDLNEQFELFIRLYRKKTKKKQTVCYYKSVVGAEPPDPPEPLTMLINGCDLHLQVCCGCVRMRYGRGLRVSVHGTGRLRSRVRHQGRPH